MSIRRRLKRLESGGPAGLYPEAVVREAMRRLTTEELETYDAMLERVAEEGAPEGEAEPAVRHIVRLCEEVANARPR